MLLLEKKDTHRVAFHLLPQDVSVQRSLQRGGLLGGGMGNKKCNIGHLPLFACGVSNGPFSVALKVGSEFQAKLGLMHFLVMAPFSMPNK